MEGPSESRVVPVGRRGARPRDREGFRQWPRNWRAFRVLADEAELLRAERLVDRVCEVVVGEVEVALVTENYRAVVISV
jgi:hypothetical protein